MSVALSHSQLEKPYHSNHEFYGLYKDRGERFLEKINKEEPFELTDGSLLTILKSSPGIQFLEEKNYKELSGGKKLFDTEIGLIALSNFKKTEEFGAGTGIGAGSKNTALQESTQCVFNALATNVKKSYIDNIDITYTAISESYQFCQTSTELEEIFDFSQNPTWRQSFLTSSNMLYEYLDNEEFEHHRDSQLINKLYDSYREINVGFQSDKWNPSDIWFVKENVLYTQFSSSLEELNQQVEDMFDKKELIGVSLKKLGKEPNIKVVNKGKMRKEYTYEGFKTTLKSKDINILYNDGKICFRTFNFATNWAGEILGKTASHGKIGFGAINTILNKFDIKLKTAKEIKLIWEEDPTYAEMVLFTLLGDFVGGIGGSFNIFIQEKNIDWKVSKLLGLNLLSNILNQPKDIKNKIITEIINYASSQLEESSVFLKLS